MCQVSLICWGLQHTSHTAHKHRRVIRLHLAAKAERAGNAQKQILGMNHAFHTHNSHARCVQSTEQTFPSLIHRNWSICLECSNHNLHGRIHHRFFFYPKNTQTLMCKEYWKQLMQLHWRCSLFKNRCALQISSHHVWEPNCSLKLGEQR